MTGQGKISNSLNWGGFLNIFRHKAECKAWQAKKEEMLKKAVIELTSDDTDPIESDQSDTVNQSRSISKKTTKTPERRKAIKLNRGEVPSLFTLKSNSIGTLQTTLIIDLDMFLVLDESQNEKKMEVKVSIVHSANPKIRLIRKRTKHR